MHIKTGSFLPRLLVSLISMTDTNKKVIKFMFYKNTLNTCLQNLEKKNNVNKLPQKLCIDIFIKTDAKNRMIEWKKNNTYKFELLKHS